MYTLPKDPVFLRVTRHRARFWAPRRKKANARCMSRLQNMPPSLHTGHANSLRRLPT